jgi:hypothetical protein
MWILDIIRGKPELLSYVMTSDTGFAPNPFHGWCTTAACKYCLRLMAQKGDWVMGTTSSSRDRGMGGAGKIIYVMQVEEVLTIGSYFGDERFEAKKPYQDDHHDYLHGDNIYEPLKEGGFRQLENPNHDGRNVEYDLKGRNVLVSRRFWYWGRCAPYIGDRFSSLIWKRPPGVGRYPTCEQRTLRSGCSGRAFQEFITWVETMWPQGGILGEPFDKGRCDSGLE